MRSVLMHPISFPLLLYLNDIRATKGLAQHFVLANHFECFDPFDKRGQVFAIAASGWEGGETSFTKRLLSIINYYEIGNSRFVTIPSEKTIFGKSDEEDGKAVTGRVDFIFHKYNTDNTKKSSVVALLEFGINNNTWWTKQDQILKYVEMLRLNNDPNYKIDQPMLISVITINNTDLTQQNIERNTLAARFGVFLCIPKNDNNFRIALLWRHATETLQDASIQFGKILCAVQLCSYLRESSDIIEKASQYEYLGPNCCKMKNLVRLI